jgi:hypothetical protein
MAIDTYSSIRSNNLKEVNTVAHNVLENLILGQIYYL